tara:strand:+ start:117 stop:272 length:156 start_codon:yes stop_codon:yes gene_type:complete
VDKVVVQTILVVLEMVVHLPLVTIVHLVVDKVLIDVNSMMVLLGVTQTKVL